jgi:trk system potassium uptake protein TrkA
MKIAVMGLGNFGLNVVRELYAMGHDVLAVDREKERAQRAQAFSSKAVIADCSDKEVLGELGLSTVDMGIISTGTNLSASILATLYLKEFGVKNVIVKAIDDDHKKVLEKVGATQVVFPEKEMAAKLAQNISMPNILDYLPLTGGFAIMEIIPPKEFIGKSLVDLDLRRKHQIQILAIKDTLKDKITMVVSPGRPIEATDSLIILGSQDSLKRIKGLRR